MTLNPEFSKFVTDWLTKANKIQLSSTATYFDKFFTLYVAYNRLYAEATFTLNRNDRSKWKSFPDHKAATDYILQFMGAENFISEIKKDEIIEQETHIYKQVKSIVFSVLSSKVIKDMASAKIVTPELYDKEGYPVDGGLMDIRLGVIDPGLRCKTCGSKLKECIGHFGYIELARPIIHVKFVNIILTLLKSTCKDCAKTSGTPCTTARRPRNHIRISASGGMMPKTRRIMRKAMASGDLA